VKSRLIVALALVFVLASVPSAFAQESESPLKIVLDQSKGQLDGLIDSDSSPSVLKLYELGVVEYDAALSSLDDEAAKDHAIVAMALFEDALYILGSSGETLVLDQLPPGFGSAIENGQGFGEGQGLGVGGVPSGILKQIDADAIFGLTLSITNSETEANNLKNLISDNSLDTSLNGYDGSINLAKELLANGDVPSAQAQLDLANEIIDGLYGEITGDSADINDEQLKAFADNTIADLESMIDAATNLHLSKFVIANLQDILDTLKSGDYNEILDVTGEGANLDLAVLVLPDLVLPPPGFEAAGDNPSDLLKGQGLGVGEIPLGIEKKIDGDGSPNGEDPKGLGDVPPGFQKKFDDPEIPLPQGFEKKVLGLESLMAGGDPGDLPEGYVEKFTDGGLAALPKGFLKKLQGVEGFEVIGSANYDFDTTAFTPDDKWEDATEDDFNLLEDDDKKKKKKKKDKSNNKYKTKNQNQGGDKGNQGKGKGG